MEPVADAAGLLQRIIDSKKLEIEEIPDMELTLTGSDSGRFKKALQRKPGHPINVIAECKKASPSMGLIRPDYDPLSISREYAKLGASAISVLTDSRFFAGDKSHLAQVKMSGLPVLRKDFIVSPKQIFESRSMGADAILLIVRILDDFQLRDFLEITRALGMDALVEIHNEAEMERALKAPTEIFGINHRDLDSLVMDLGITEKIAPVIRSSRSDAVIVAESGVESASGRLRVDSYADAILIGTALMKSRDISAEWKKIFSSGP